MNKDKNISIPDSMSPFERIRRTNAAGFGNTAYIIPTNDIWLVGLLNSKLLWWFYLYLSASIRGGFVRYIGQYMEQLPIPPATATQKIPIIERVRQILAAPDSPAVPHLEAEIDRLVYKLYGLTEDEIAIVEGLAK
ncbi:MAG: TaqI-like C-terminal specificity domain-containing protein [Smithellaceae bacterium]|nr:TaqI-like C-terminal specificity domain-containing protein [Smithellaceae bacterium]